MKEKFLKRMKDMLQDEYPKYLKTLEEERFRGVRVNTLKCDVAVFQEEFPYPLTPTPFCQESFYLASNVEHVGNHPLHLAGCCYMQEPSASSAVEILDVQKGDWVLDMCAAPGGKSGQIAAKLANTGFLMSNEIEAKRAQILMSNMERLGVSENIVVSAHPEELCKTCAGWFDKVLVDAPCSGEGMFKKHSAAMEDWSEEHVAACGKRQIQILHSAYHALKEGGILVYSTCTYAMEENEAVVAQFLADFPDMEQEDCHVSFGREGISYPGMEKQKVRRIFPMDQGEGHFIAKFRKTGKTKTAKQTWIKQGTLPAFCEKALSEMMDMPKGYFMIHKDKVFWKPTPFLNLGNMRILRQGVLCGEIIKNRLEPHQHLFTSAFLQPYLHQVYSMSEEETHIFLSGNQLFVQGYKGYVALAYQQYILGFGKGDGMVIKNKYPKGLRILGK